METIKKIKSKMLFIPSGIEKNVMKRQEFTSFPFYLPLCTTVKNERHDMSPVQSHGGAGEGVNLRHI